MGESVLDDLIHRADLDGLIRLIDAHVSARQWARLLELRDRARTAVRTGRQLWPAATLAEYRLALWAPAEWAARVLDEDSGRSTIGPLAEVVAQHHTFAELAPHVAAGPRLGFIAHERALRGEQIDPSMAPVVLEMPFERQPWEPSYLLPVYSDEGVTADPPPTPRTTPQIRHTDAGESASSGSAIARAAQIDDPAVTLAVRQLLEPWTAASNGRVEVVCVEGDASAAVSALGAPRHALTRLTAAEAMQWLAWAGGTGGAHGRRRGSAIGRFGAWWLLGALGDLLDAWPVPADELGALATSLQWSWWDAGEPTLGWELQIAVEDAAEGYAWAISAHDAV